MEMQEPGRVQEARREYARAIRELQRAQREAYARGVALTPAVEQAQQDVRERGEALRHTQGAAAGMHALPERPRGRGGRRVGEHASARPVEHAPRDAFSLPRAPPR